MSRRALSWSLAAACTIAGCAVASEDAATEIPAEAVPFDLLDPEAPNVVEVVDGRSVEVCLFRDDRLAVVDRRLDRDGDLRDLLASLAGLSEADAEAGLESALSGTEDVTSIELSGGVAVVDFEANADQTLTPDPLATIAQIVCTLTRQPGIGAVRFAVEGDPIDVPRDDGSLTDAPVTADDYRELMAP